MRIKKVEFIKDFELKILFNDNKTKIVDLKEIVKKGKGMFLPLKKPEYFKLASVDSDGITICWPNGADLSPDVLYEMGVEVKDSAKKTSRKKAVRPSSASTRSRARIAAKSKY